MNDISHSNLNLAITYCINGLSQNRTHGLEDSIPGTTLTYQGVISLLRKLSRAVIRMEDLEYLVDEKEAKINKLNIKIADLQGVIDDLESEVYNLHLDQHEDFLR